MTVTSGLKCVGSWTNSGPLGSLERTLLGTSIWASTMCFLTWVPAATPAGRLLFRLALSGLGTDVTESGLLPTPEASNTKAVALRSAGRSPRNFLATPTAKANQLSPSMGKWAGCRLWATPTARDFRSPGRSRLERTGSKAGECLPQEVGGQLNPLWVEWLQGFPPNWTEL